MIKTIYGSRKRGVKWDISAGKTYFKQSCGDKILGYMRFYLLPTIEYDRHFRPNQEDNSFDICFKWLFWEFVVSRFWGKAYM